MKEITEKEPNENPHPEHPPKKKSALYKFTMFANLMTIPALAFYFYVGLGGKMNGYFLLLIFMIVSEYLVMRRYLNDEDKDK